ncbi:MAG: hypothetical protein APF84_17160 [Gracilibacter sp. BRH_c7a]|nr:MAG: hypothetical protein APF84_17160 [Gracilibacter sp. BRH_c7a]
MDEITITDNLGSMKLKVELFTKYLAPGILQVLLHQKAIFREAQDATTEILQGRDAAWSGEAYNDTRVSRNNVTM